VLRHATTTNLHLADEGGHYDVFEAIAVEVCDEGGGIYTTPHLRVPLEGDVLGAGAVHNFISDLPVNHR
jgi:hypothetical protein